MGDVLDDQQDISSLFLYDGKEILVQKNDHQFQLHQTSEKSSYFVIVKEWRSDTWQFGSTYEIQINKMLTC